MLSASSRRFLQLSSVAMSATSIYQFKVKDADNKEVTLDKYKGKVLIVVNVASQCGLTNSNYTQFKELLDKYKSKGLEVAAFPCNQFGSQEPACELDIKNFVANKFNFEPDLYAKIDVNGDKADPLFKYLKKEQGGTMFDAIKWNFTKFLVDREGNVVKRYGPTTEPKDMVKDIEQLLAKDSSTKL
ncbi:Glutathione peroxidase [Trichostrongylus colubriformis]|uniref:Glutathione peroxidase n=1 Tax=Trichostrongylus colubriformis TaxID=6319 RepID=A0AAN8FPM3_TRICO